MEMQGLLEEERLASAHQAETFTRQIHNLQAQLRLLQEELRLLEEQRQVELEEVQQELRGAQEEVQLLQQEAQEAGAERGERHRLPAGGALPAQGPAPGPEGQSQPGQAGGGPAQG
ncbi:uncharacterized protein ACNS7B_001570, partial [Menidia menidia]